MDEREYEGKATAEELEALGLERPEEKRGATPEDARLRGVRNPARGESKDRPLAERGETK